MSEISENNQSKGRWVLFPWFEEYGTHHIHPEDIDSVRAFHPYCILFKIIGSSDNYLLISHGEIKFRVKDNLISYIDELVESDINIIDVGEAVMLRNKDKEAKIEKIAWHYKKSEPFYLVSVDGTSKSKRYWISDFIV